MQLLGKPGFVRSCRVLTHDDWEPPSRRTIGRHHHCISALFILYEVTLGVRHMPGSHTAEVSMCMG